MYFPKSWIFFLNFTRTGCHRVTTKAHSKKEGKPKVETNIPEDQIKRTMQKPSNPSQKQCVKDPKENSFLYKTPSKIS
jgi:hypothetical protein